MWELFGGSLIYSVAKDAWAAIRGRRRRLSSKRVLELRQKWKKEIDPTLWKRSQQKLGLDAIIRDMKRLDQYPEDTKANRKGISAWFKVGLSSTYHNGIEVNLGWHGLVKDANGWRLLDYEAGEKEGKTVALIATIPYERIESIDWSGDNFYGESQIYCHFEGKGSVPYDDCFYATHEQSPGGPLFCLKIATYDEVKKNTKKARRSR
jgi:hypothetical protein